jgi:hypothetical protein
MPASGFERDACGRPAFATPAVAGDEPTLDMRPVATIATSKRRAAVRRQVARGVLSLDVVGPIRPMRPSIAIVVTRAANEGEFPDTRGAAGGECQETRP